MAKRLFVGGLPYDFTDAQLKDLFAKAGTVVSANVIVDKFTQRSKGFGFVELSSDEEAEKAVKELNGNDLGGRKIAVAEARPMEERAPRRDFGGGDKGYGRRDDNRKSGGFQKRSRSW